MNITKMQVEKSMRGMRQSEQPPQIRIRFTDNGIVINQALAHQMHIVAGDRIFFAFGQTDARSPMLLLAKTTQADADGFCLRKEHNSQNLFLTSKPLVVSLLKAYALARTQCRGLVFTLQIDPGTVQKGDGIVYFNLGKPVQMKGGKVS